MSKLQNVHLLVLIFYQGRKHKPVNIAGCSSPTWTVRWKVINMHRAPRLINVMRAIKMGSQSLHTFADDTPVQLFSRTRDHLARGTFHLIGDTYHLVRATYHLPRAPRHLSPSKSHISPSKGHLPPIKSHLPPSKSHLSLIKRHLPPIKSHLSPN